MEILSLVINGLSIAGWAINIKHRRQAMYVFTVSTVLSIIYFTATAQWPWLARSVFYLVIDIVTLWHISREEKTVKQAP